MIIAAVRSTSPGLAFGADHVAPFVTGRLAAAHNGRIEDFRGQVGRAIIASLSDEAWAKLGVCNDSRTLVEDIASRYQGNLVAATSKPYAASRRYSTSTTPQRR